MKPCPSPQCQADAARLRLGPLGEVKGVWCAVCGFRTTTVAGWENRPTPVTDPAPKPLPSGTPTNASARKLFNNRQHGPMQHACPGLDLLPLVDVDAIPDKDLGMVVGYLFDEVWTTATSPERIRDRLRELLKGVNA